MVACLPQFTEKEEAFLTGIYRKFDDNPKRNWYAKQQEKENL
jgi:hypothetical protein